MISIGRYMDDGANWQAQAVLAYVRSMEYIAKEVSVPDDVSEDENTEVKRLLSFVDVVVGRYENCREQGYVFGVRLFGVCRNFAVFEHRNSDTLCVNVFDGLFINTPKPDEVWKGKETKWDYDYGFTYGHIVECGDKILELMQEFVETEIKKFIERMRENQAKS